MKKGKYIRYKILEMIAKRLTPKFYYFNLKELIDYALNHPRLEITAYRPAINNIMREYSFFQNKALKGAEIGVLYGLNSENILENLAMEKLYLIDIWDDYGESDNSYNHQNAYNEVKRKFGNKTNVEILKGYSSEIAKKIEDHSLDFVYIDANHSYEFVYQDLCSWNPKVKKNGIVAGHDIGMKEVMDAVLDFGSKFHYEIYYFPPDWIYYKGDGNE